MPRIHSTGDPKCIICGKSFAKASSHRRHYYYCRSKVPRTASRKTACKRCVGAKIKCDGGMPACSSCVLRSIACEYDDDALVNAWNATTDCTQAMEPYKLHGINNEDIVFEDGSNMGFEDGEPGVLAAQEDSTYVARPSPFYRPINDTYFDMNTSCRTSHHKATISLPELELNLTDHTHGMFIPYLNQAGSIRHTVDRLGWRSPMDIVPREQKSPQAEMASTLIIQIITAIPRKMLRKETFPPFIHPGCCAHDAEGEMTETLTSCMVLAQMFTNRTKQSAKVLWRAVRAELERLYNQYNTFSNFELLAAVQALLVYTIMRFMSDNTILELSQLDRPLLQCLNAVSSHVTIRLGGGEFRDAIPHGQQDWRDWIFMESRRRITTIARIMNMVLHIENGINCEPLEGFALVPLPAKKTLWEASSPAQWSAEFETESIARELFGLTIEGKLVKLKQKDGLIETIEGTWEEWYAGADAFGAVIMLAAQLLG